MKQAFTVNEPHAYDFNSFKIKIGTAVTHKAERRADTVGFSLPHGFMLFSSTVQDSYDCLKKGQPQS